MGYPSKFKVKLTQRLKVHGRLSICGLRRLRAGRRRVEALSVFRKCHSGLRLPDAGIMMASSRMSQSSLCPVCRLPTFIFDLLRGRLGGETAPIRGDAGHGSILLALRDCRLQSSCTRCMHRVKPPRLPARVPNSKQ